MANDIARIMYLDPLKMSREDREKLIEYYHSYRARLARGADPKKLLKQAEELDIVPLPPPPVFKKRI
jgi:hypothetical protein